MKKIVEPIAATRTPLVRLSPGTKNGTEFSVATNDREVSAEMTRYLASLGHTKIAFIKGHSNHKAVANRYRGYLDGLKQSGLTVPDDFVAQGDNSIGSGQECAEELLNRKQRPTAIFAANDDMAAGVIRVAYRLGIDVPGELSVAGCDDNSLARQIFPALTTIRQPLVAMAERAALAIISDARDGSISPGTEVFPAQLQIRDSTGPAPAKAKAKVSE
jgi:LacI family transcriptional regulator